MKSRHAPQTCIAILLRRGAIASIAFGAAACANDLTSHTPIESVAVDDASFELVGTASRGFTLGDASCDELQILTARFPEYRYYNWWVSPPCSGTQQQFIPMIWDEENYASRIASVRNVLAAQPQDQRWLLGPNECNVPSQCNLTTRRVAKLWRQIETDSADLDPGLVFAVPSHDAPADWIWRVVGAYKYLYGTLPRIDRFALHAYFGPDDSEDSAEAFKTYLTNQLATIDRGAPRPTILGPCGSAQDAGSECQFASRATVDWNGTTLDSIVANGKYYNYEGNAGWRSNGSLLTSVTRYASGPCQGKQGADCIFSTRDLMRTDDGLVESITAYGRYYNFTSSVPWSSNGGLLQSVARYAAGPCAYKGDSPCDFETRAQEREGSAIVESITAYGRYFEFTKGGGPPRVPEVPNGTPLSAISRYSAPGGPCTGRADCRFDARTILIAGSDRIDSVIAYGRTWAWRRHAGQSWSQATLEGWVPASGLALDTVERYDDERYYSGDDFAGTKAWLTEFGTECWNNPTDAENSTFMNSVLPWLDNTPAIDRHFWFTGRIDDNPSWDSCELIDHTTKQLTSYGHLYAGVRACTSLPGFTTAHGQRKLENGDGRFACWDGTYSYCGSSPNTWTQYGVQTAAEGKVLGPWKCSSGWWND